MGCRDSSRLNCLKVGKRCSAHGSVTRPLRVGNQSCLQGFPGLRGVCRVFDLGKRILADESIEGETALPPQLDQLRYENIWNAVALNDTAHRPPEQDPVHIKGDFGAERRYANDTTGTRQPQAIDRLPHHLRQSRAFQRVLHAFSTGVGLDRCDRILATAVHDVSGSELFGQGQARIVKIDRDNCRTTNNFRGHNGRKPDRPRAKYSDAGSALWLQRIDHGACTSLYAATERSHDLDRHVARNLDHVAFACHRIFAERRLREEISADTLAMSVTTRT